MLTKILTVLKLIKFFIKDGKEIIYWISRNYQKYGKPIISNIKLTVSNFNQRFVSWMKKPVKINKSFTPDNVLLRIGQTAFLIGVIVSLIFACMIYAVKLNQGIPFYKLTAILASLITFIVIGGIITFPSKITY